MIVNICRQRFRNKDLETKTQVLSYDDPVIESYPKSRHHLYILTTTLGVILDV